MSNARPKVVDFKYYHTREKSTPEETSTKEEVSENEVSLKRSNSFCTLSYSDGMTKTYTRQQRLLGMGGYGNVYKMVSEDNEAFAVKEFVPTHLQRYAFYEADIVADLSFIDRLSKHEMLCNQKFYGMGFLYQTNENLKVVDCKIRETTYPVTYMVMPFIDGNLIYGVPLSSPQEYLQLSIAILKTLKEFHEKGFVHGDIKNDNILIAKDNNNQFTARFIDFSYTRKPGNWLETTGLNLYNKPPEFENTIYIAANFTHDIYTVGMMLQNNYLALNEVAGFSTFPFAADINKICTKMRSKNPKARPTIDEVLYQFEKLQMKAELTEAIKSSKTEVRNCQQFFSTASQLRVKLYLKKLDKEIKETKSFSFGKLKITYHRSKIQSISLFNKKFQITCSKEQKKAGAEAILNALNETNESTRHKSLASCETNFAKEINNGRLEPIYYGTLLHR